MIRSFPTNSLCAEEGKATIQKSYRYFTHHEPKTDATLFDSEPDVKAPRMGLGNGIFYLLWFLISQRLGRCHSMGKRPVHTGLFNLENMVGFLFSQREHGWTFQEPEETSQKRTPKPICSPSKMQVMKGSEVTGRPFLRNLMKNILRVRAVSKGSDEFLLTAYD